MEIRWKFLGKHPLRGMVLVLVPPAVHPVYPQHFPPHTSQMLEFPLNPSTQNPWNLPSGQSYIQSPHRIDALGLSHLINYPGRRERYLE